MDVPPTLRAWFVAHAVACLVAAGALFFAPELILPRLGWTAIDPITARLAGAALLAIGAQSLRVRNAGVETYRTMLSLLVIWSLAGAVGLFVGVGQAAPNAAWALMSIFVVFAGVWVHHAIRFRQLDRAPADTAAPEAGSDQPDDDPPHGDGAATV
jgi:hypothetical protein